VKKEHKGSLKLPDLPNGVEKHESPQPSPHPQPQPEEDHHEKSGEKEVPVSARSIHVQSAVGAIEMKLLDLDKTKEYEALRALGRDFIASVKVMVDGARGTDKVYPPNLHIFVTVSHCPIYKGCLYNSCSKGGRESEDSP